MFIIYMKILSSYCLQLGGSGAAARRARGHVSQRELEVAGD
jgi:hypothetical protein